MSLPRTRPRSSPEHSVSNPIDTQRPAPRTDSDSVPKVSASTAALRRRLPSASELRRVDRTERPPSPATASPALDALQASMPPTRTPERTQPLASVSTGARPLELSASPEADARFRLAGRSTRSRSRSQWFGWATAAVSCAGSIGLYGLGYEPMRRDYETSMRAAATARQQSTATLADLRAQLDRTRSELQQFTAAAEAPESQTPAADSQSMGAAPSGDALPSRTQSEQIALDREARKLAREARAEARAERAAARRAQRELAREARAQRVAARRAERKLAREARARASVADSAASAAAASAADTGASPQGGEPSPSFSTAPPPDPRAPSRDALAGVLSESRDPLEGL